MKKLKLTRTNSLQFKIINLTFDLYKKVYLLQLFNKFLIEKLKLVLN